MYARDVDFVGGFLGSIPPLLVPEITGSRSASSAVSRDPDHQRPTRATETSSTSYSGTQGP